jgi:hypothetical protein
MHWDGNTWSVVNYDLAAGYNDVWGTASDDVWVVGWFGAIAHWDGNAWSSVDSGVTNVLYGVQGAASDDVWAVGYSGTIVHYNGTTWSPMDAGTTDTIREGIFGGTEVPAVLERVTQVP